MNSYLTNWNLSDFHATTDIEKAWAILKQHISLAIDAFIPKVKFHTSQHPKWFDSQIRHHIKCLCTLRRKTKNHFTEANLQRLIQAEDTLLHLMFKAKSDYEQNLINGYLHDDMYIYATVTLLLILPYYMHWSYSTQLHTYVAI